MLSKDKLAELKKFLKNNWLIILAALYFVIPIDLIPDVLIPLGYSDDAILILGALLEYFKKQRTKTASTSDDDVKEAEIVD